jgi:putative transcriptional regulator
MIHHHPDDALLLAHAAGKLTSGFAIVVASHVETCAQCRERMRLFEAMGGAVLEDAAPAELPADSLARALQAIDAPQPAPSSQAPEPQAAWPALPTGAVWPRSLAGCRISRWR